MKYTEPPSMDEFPLVLSRVGLTGDRLRALRNEPEPLSPLPGFLDPEPGLHALIGDNQAGKTTFAINLTLAWATGSAPWEGAPALPKGRVLVLSNEQNARRIVRRACWLTGFRPGDATCARYPGWEELVIVVAKDHGTAVQLRRLDYPGVEALRGSLIYARDVEHQPISFVLLDSLQRLKDPAVAENSADDMVRFLDPLQQLCIDFNVYALLVHHTGHGGDGRNTNRTSRGSTAIGDVTVGQWTLKRDGPFHRVLHLDGNEIEQRSVRFRVAPDDRPGMITCWERDDHEPASARAQTDFTDNVKVGEIVSQTELARRVGNASTGTQPSGTASRRARAAIELAVGLGRARRDQHGVTRTS